ncbi:MAG: glycosyltransferase family 4 protein [Candidatus Omnitrophica bacterium]|nr:glycosyltransferase family 4 protein [Candidatus Omnitrophota bacterium]
MGKIKVLHIITRLDPGGSSVNTIETVARLDPSRFEVFLISGRTNDPDGSIERSLKQKKIAYWFLFDLQREINLWHDIKAFFRLYGFMKRYCFDIVHTHSSKAGILGRWAAKWAGVKRIVHTPHGHIFYGYFGKIKTAIFVWMERVTALITDKIITLTHLGTKEHLDFKIARLDKFVTIYSGIDISWKPAFNTPLEKEQFKRNYNIPQDFFIFGCVARLDAIKGISYLIESMGKVVAEYPQTGLILVGKGEQEQRLKEKARSLGIENHVVFTGFQKEIGRFMECMDVFVLPSLNEGMGRVVLEAMACTKPVIATRVGGLAELVEDGVNGLLVEPASAESLTAAMLKLRIDCSLREAMAREAVMKIGERFSLKKMVQDIEGLYDGLQSTIR